jgi:hypothetical protein
VLGVNTCTCQCHSSGGVASGAVLQVQRRRASRSRVGEKDGVSKWLLQGGGCWH